MSIMSAGGIEFSSGFMVSPIVPTGEISYPYKDIQSPLVFDGYIYILPDTE